MSTATDGTTPPVPPFSTALLTDHYELTMLAAALADGTAGRHSVFEVFARRLPAGRRYGVVAGTGRLLEAVSAFRFERDHLDWLASAGVVDDTTLDYLADYRFGGDIVGYAEGETYFPYSPVLTVEGTFAESVLLETVVLSILNHDCAVASAASRMVQAAGSRPCVEMGSRRTHESAAVAAARAAYVAGFASTSNLQAGYRYGIPTRGTSAHSFTLLHDDEESAFASQVASLGPATTLLVDTFDVDRGVASAVEVAGTRLGGVRLDSGDLVEQAGRVRAQLDALGATSTRIIVTSDLDEYAIAALAAAPADAYGVGTQLVTGSGAPTAAMVYKLVARADADGVVRSVEKLSLGKSGHGGRKTASRRLRVGVAQAEVVTAATPSRPPRGTRQRGLQVPLVTAGEIVGAEDLARARDRHHASVAELPVDAHKLSAGEPVIPTIEGGP